MYFGKEKYKKKNGSLKKTKGSCSREKHDHGDIRGEDIHGRRNRV